jgi:hypothetical protein
MPLLYRLWELGSRVCLSVIAAGAVGALFGWRPGAYLIGAGLVALLLTRLGIAVLEYRRVMSRPWPKVRPLRDDEW